MLWRTRLASSAARTWSGARRLVRRPRRMRILPRTKERPRHRKGRRNRRGPVRTIRRRSSRAGTSSTSIASGAGLSVNRAARPGEHSFSATGSFRPVLSAFPCQSATGPSERAAGAANSPCRRAGGATWRGCSTWTPPRSRPWCRCSSRRGRRRRRAAKSRRGGDPASAGQPRAEPRPRGVHGAVPGDSLPARSRRQPATDPSAGNARSGSVATSEPCSPSRSPVPDHRDPSTSVHFLCARQPANPAGGQPPRPVLAPHPTRSHRRRSLPLRPTSNLHLLLSAPRLIRAVLRPRLRSAPVHAWRRASAAAEEPLSDGGAGFAAAELDRAA